MGWYKVAHRQSNEVDFKNCEKLFWVEFTTLKKPFQLVVMLKHVSILLAKDIACKND